MRQFLPCLDAKALNGFVINILGNQPVLHSAGARHLSLLFFQVSVVFDGKFRLLGCVGREVGKFRA